VEPVVIQFENVTKRFRVYKNGNQRFLALFSAKYRRSLPTATALQNVSLTIRRGEVVNIIGAGGSGKSTLLDIIKGVITPGGGSVTVNGKVFADLETTAGFNSNYSGLKNLRVKGVYLGMSTAEIDEVLPKAVEFSELGELINTPINSYTRDERTCLPPAFAMSLKPDILLIDKSIIAGGSKAFRKKCRARLDEILSDPNVTCLYVSTLPNRPNAYSNRGIILDNGKIVFDGTLDDAKTFYGKTNETHEVKS
jgi:teichoic acid transport system ATP-binding protein